MSHTPTHLSFAGTTEYRLGAGLRAAVTGRVLTPCCACSAHRRANMEKAMGRRWPRSRTSSYGRPSLQKQDPSYISEKTNGMAFFLTAVQTWASKERGSRKQRLRKREGGKGRETLPSLRTRHIHNYLHGPPSWSFSLHQKVCVQESREENFTLSLNSQSTFTF